MSVTIAPTIGSAVALAAAATSVAFSAAAQLIGQTIVVSVAILDTTKSVSGISDGTNVFTQRSAGNNSTNIRVEEWTCVVASSATRTITVNFSGSTLGAAAYEEYAGPPTLGNIAAVFTGNTNLPGSNGAQPIQDQGNWFVAAIAVRTSAGDTFGAYNGNIRQSAVSAAATGASIALVDFGPFNYGIVGWTPGIQISAGALRQFAGADLQLRTGNGAPSTVLGASFLGPVPTPDVPAHHQTTRVVPIQGVQPYPIAQVLQGGTVGVAYSETISGIGGVAPYAFLVTVGALPNGTTLNPATGVISGTPTLAGTYNFTIQVTDANGLIGIYAFQSTIGLPSGGSVTYAG